MQKFWQVFVTIEEFSKLFEKSLEMKYYQI